MADNKPRFTASVNEVNDKSEILQIKTPEDRLLCYQACVVGEDLEKGYWNPGDDIVYEEVDIEGVDDIVKHPCHIVRTFEAKVGTSGPTTADNDSDKASYSAVL